MQMFFLSFDTFLVDIECGVDDTDSDDGLGVLYT